MKLMKKLLAFATSLAAFVTCLLSAPLATAKADTVVDVTQNVYATDWIAQNELKVTYLNLGTGVIPNAIGYGVIDNDGYKYVQEYVAINGRTIQEINSDTSLNATQWTYTVFPSTADAKYKLPIIVFANNGMLEIKIHNNYAEMLGGRVEITAKAGLYFKNSGVRYEVTADKTFTVWEAPTLTQEDVTDRITLTGWDVTGDKGELTYTRLVFGQDVLPEGINYGVLDKPDYKYLQEYIVLNGKSIKEINEGTDTSSYAFYTFPSSVADQYKIPVIVFANNGALEIKIHNDYIKTLGERVEITVKSGLYVVNGNTQYTVEKDIEYMLVGNVWVDKNKTYSVTYYLNGVQYGEVERVPANTPLVLRDDPKTERGYYFGGWEYEGVSAVVQDMEIHGYFKAIRYSVSYQVNGGVNDSTNPIVYYVTDGEVLLKEATKEGAIFKGWYTSETYEEEVTSLYPDNLGDITLYASFEELPKGSGGCSSTASLGVGVVALAGVAVAFRKKRK